ncbi:MAG: 4Fe-4S binding protein [Vicinamibacterales bacterium]|jgi:ferredoxin|nr:4Fe-4S binding protein [Vicinamibacterales bacterium]
MALRNIIRIDEALCDGCGECVPSCAEGALQVIDGKARLVKVGIRGAILADSEV